MAKRNLLLCFDAFGTLFRIKQPIERQYGDVARRQFGVAADVPDSELRDAFRAAFKAQSRAHPNYGRWTSGMGATAWWTRVIEETFRPFVPGSLPPGLAPQLLARFASSDGYAMDDGLVGSLRAWKEERRTQRQAYDRVVVGVITNSDDRVPGILSSFGLRVSPLRYGTADPLLASSSSAAAYDIDFHCMSYDVGVEKPDPAIFRAAESLLPTVLGGDGQGAAQTVDLDDWDKVYVGDEAAKDVAGAHAAGWNAVLIQADEATTTTTTTIPTRDDGHGPRKDAVVRHLADCPPQPLGLLFGATGDKTTVVGVESSASFVEWLLASETDGNDGL
ncbi:uncharacterized protein SPSK_03499 [Sporothrix schenckii 1099-18]|uniref:Haloacid dehalogenase n=1 Tax=Sporothrix schenckii 1099-18 TaxID=1397361 RepID=A0A0F2LX16_SPOSC|nr:uncharacterized protein SPSK_03499 [Sporothrix schenckii 1099-18]KJR81998.1 hypothetical protein SPSK_03499 [Sporothrix schenckii 1099-18]